MAITGLRFRYFILIILRSSTMSPPLHTFIGVCVSQSHIDVHTYTHKLNHIFVQNWYFTHNRYISCLPIQTPLLTTSYRESFLPAFKHNFSLVVIVLNIGMAYSFLCALLKGKNVKITSLKSFFFYHKYICTYVILKFNTCTITYAHTYIQNR